MRIAVIGGTGNIGTATVRSLSSGGHEVVSGLPASAGDESHPVTGNPSCGYSLQKAATEVVLTKATDDEHFGGRMLISWLRPTLVGQRIAAGALGRVGVSPASPGPFCRIYR